MKPPLDAKVRRPSPYFTAEFSRKPGYLARRFADIRRAQKEREEAEHQEKLAKIVRMK